MPEQTQINSTATGLPMLWHRVTIRGMDMGQANRRGSHDQRKKEGVEAAEKRVAIAEARRRLCRPTKGMVQLAVIQAMCASFTK
jgi:hypothetical protein